MGHWGTCLPRLQLFNFSGHLRPHKLWHSTPCGCLVPPRTKSWRRHCPEITLQCKDNKIPLLWMYGHATDTPTLLWSFSSRDLSAQTSSSFIRAAEAAVMRLQMLLLPGSMERDVKALGEPIVTIACYITAMLIIQLPLLCKQAWTLRNRCRLVILAIEC